MLTLGTISLGLGLVLLVVTGKLNIGTIIPGGVCLIVGFGYRNRPYFELVEGAFRAPAAIGPLVKTYDFPSLDVVRIRDGKVWVGEKKLGLSRMMSHPEDWAALERHLASVEAFD